jgi:hypothetical protein
MLILGSKFHINYRWEDNIKMDPEEVRLESVDWIHLAQDRDMWRALVNR